MADIELKSFPFDSMKVLNEQSGEMEDDRLYEAQIFRDYFRKFLSNGVYFGTYKNYGDNSMKVVLDTGLTIKVKKGCGIIEGVDYENESDRLITLDRPASGNRVDRVVVQMNSSLDTRKTKIIVKQGNGTTPAELTRTDNVYEICLAEIIVKSTSNIVDGDIIDTRLDTNLCGIVNSLISVNGEEIYQKFQEYVQSVEENMMLKNKDIVDDLVSTDTDKALSAKQGKELNDNKVNTSDILDNLTSTDTNKPLSAKQGKVLKDLIDNTYTKTQSDVKYKSNGDFAVIDQVVQFTSSSTGKSISLPTGFSGSNCVIINIMFDYQNMPQEYYARLYASTIKIWTDLTITDTEVFNCKIVLMKVS